MATDLPLAFAELMAGGVLLMAGYKGYSPGQIITGEAGDALPFAGASDDSANGSSSGSATNAGSVGGGARSIVHYLVRNGLTATAAAGVVGNLQQESSLNASTPGGGLAQWIGSRWTDLQQYAAARGLSADSQEAQLEYLVNDLHTNYSSTLTQLNAASTPSQAATIFSDQYERPGDPMLTNRQQYAEQAYRAAGY